MQYTVFAPQSGLVPESDELHLAAYLAWRSIWSDVFKEVGYAGDLSSDEFIRHDRCCVLHDGAKVAGVHLYSFFDLRNELQLHRKYLADNFDASARAAIQAQSCDRVMTMEYLSVTPDFRGAKIAELLVSLGMRVFLDENVDAIIACTRNSRKVNQMGITLGFQTLSSGLVAHGEEADLMLFTRAQEFKTHAFLQKEIERLWNERTDLRPSQRRRGLRAA